MEKLEVATRGQQGLSIAKNNKLGREVEGVCYVTPEAPQQDARSGLEWQLGTKSKVEGSRDGHGHREEQGDQHTRSRGKAIAS